MKKKLIVTAAACSLSLPIAADTYQTEAEFFISKIDNTKSIGAEVDYHFSPVDSSHTPYKESAFLNKSSYISGIFERFDGDNDDFNHAGLGAQIQVDNHWFINARYTEIDDQDIFAIGTGAYLNDLTALSFSYSLFENSDVFDIDRYTLAIKGLTNSKASGVFAYNLAITRAELEFVSTGSQFNSNDTEYEGSLDYFFTQGFSIGAAFEISDALDIYTLNTEYYTNEKQSFYLEFNNLQSDDAEEEDDNRVVAGIRFRF